MTPNLKPVDAVRCIWRAGQPETALDWAQIKSSGVANVIKLNGDDPATDPDALPDDQAVILGLSLYKVTVSPLTQVLNPIEAAKQIEQVIWFIADHSLIHCSHGQDRTGLCVAMWRHKVCGWTKEDAEKEMLDNGFHKELLGLWLAWLAAK